jgi:hypothetical protein
MTGFDRRTQQAMNQTKQEHSTHIELLERRQKQQRELAAKAIEAEKDKHRRLEKQRSYDNSVSKIISTASIKSPSGSLSRGLIQEAAANIQADTKSSQMDKNIAGIYETLPGFLQAETLLHKSYLPDDQYEKLRLNRVLFNESLKNIIDTDPKTTTEELHRYTTDAALTYGYKGNELAFISEATDTTIQGMRHELALESVLYRIGYEVEETTPQDDLHGIDYRIEREDGTRISIDVKASEAAAERSIQNSNDWHRNNGTTKPANELVLYSGFTKYDFEATNPWRPTEQAIQRVIPLIEASIDAVPSYSDDNAIV